ncbi:MAG: hypothetical protein L0H41_12960, partial [Microlunatus sp.]|nr:hypothetical protein [Microlunatus sp.]
MPRSESQRAIARHALTRLSPRAPDRFLSTRLMKTGLASLVISVLGFGVAASVHSPSAAEGTDGSTLDVAAPIHTTITPGV